MASLLILLWTQKVGFRRSRKRKVYVLTCTILFYSSLPVERLWAVKSIRNTNLSGGIAMKAPQDRVRPLKRRSLMLTNNIWFTRFLATDRPQLRLILKVGGGASTPDLIDHGENSYQNSSTIVQPQYAVEDDSQQSSHFNYSENGEREKQKKKKEKKKKKNKDKDKEKKKHKHKVSI